MDQIKVVVFDAMGVLYEDGDVQGRVLIPYLRDQGSGVPEEEIRAAYRAATLGRLSTEEFWAAASLAGGAVRDEDYCRRHRLTGGAREAIAELAGDGLETACLSNDTAAWSACVRRRFGLDRLVRRWFVSSALRARKPDPAAYEAVLDGLGVRPGEVVLVDDRPVNLAPARSMGMRTILFVSDDTAANPAPGPEPERRVTTMPELVAAVRAPHP
ncbi:HAD family hydrolase [Nonomuraea zeae]|uniref:HAD family hydrolase n=1 Tax=Nonomuraea zeae TaxID=1642303 RepID=A0A5S4GE87_9ACTN|nr:HAD-IA family hydrolase [Nonomuraea zeae]TMR30781.1 HAD family hydrolase [Nonomuraea zeae]